MSGFKRALLGVVIVLGTLVSLLALVLGIAWWKATPAYKVPSTISTKTNVVTLEGVRFHTQSFGKKEAPVIVVIHGGPGGDFRSLLPLKSLAKEGYRVVFYDQRGSGLSPRVPASQLTLQSSVEDLHRIVKWAGKGKPVALLGHSWGGILATFYLNKYPKGIKAAALIEPGVLTSAEMTAFVKVMQPKMNWESIKYITRTLLETTRIKGPDKYAGQDYFFSRMMFAKTGNPLTAYYCNKTPPKGALSFWRVGATASQAIITASQLKDGTFTMPSLKGLKKYKTEVLLLAGSCNTLIGPKRQKEHLKLFAKASLQIIPRAGHMMHLSQPARTKKTILSYYKRLGFLPKKTP